VECVEQREGEGERGGEGEGEGEEGGKRKLEREGGWREG